MIESLRELLHRRDLLFMVAWRDIRVKYKESVMGLLWAVLMPVVIVSAGMLVKFAFAMLSGRAVHVLDVMGVAVKSVPYAFVVASIRFGTMCLITNQDLVTKIYLPRLVFPFAAVLSEFASTFDRCWSETNRVAQLRLADAQARAAMLLHFANVEQGSSHVVAPEVHAPETTELAAPPVSTALADLDALLAQCPPG